MASEIFASRLELRRRLRARLGDTVNDAEAVQTQDQINEILRGAATYVRDDCDWKRLKLESFFSTGVDQRYYNYPLNSGPGDVLHLGRWDANANRYVTLARRLILPNLDLDPSLTGDDRTAQQGAPVQFEEGSQTGADTDGNALPVPAIELWPIPDAIYAMKLDYNAGGAQLADETTPCLVDAELILYVALAAIYEDDGRDARAKSMMGMYDRRRRRLSGSQRTAEPWRRGLGEHIRRRAGIRYREPPNIDTSPSVMPS